MAKNNNVNVMNQLFDGHALFVRALLIGLWLEGYGAGFYASEPHPHGLCATRRVCGAQMEGWRSWEEWCGRGWMNGPSVCSERLSGWTRNLPGMRWLTGSSWHARAAKVKIGSFLTDESEKGRGWAASSQPLTSKSEALKQLLSQRSLGTKTDLSYWEEKRREGWGEKCGCN